MFQPREPLHHPGTGHFVNQDGSISLPPMSEVFGDRRPRRFGRGWFLGLDSEGESVNEPTPYDGLGDRNRSLSPEGDNIWGTLQSTVTPDPQPPSVGSSFASTTASASAAASQGAATASSRTSFTNPDLAEETGLEPPCDSGCENSDTEGDEEDDMEQNPLTRFASGLRVIRRSYADVTRGSDDNIDDPLELLGGIGGMHRIVSNLARRQDIPDEWWQEAGLSRTLPQDNSSN